MMIPGLSGFIADGGDPQVRDDPQAWEGTAAAVLEALAAEFEVVPERRTTAAGDPRTTWLDTFDWRLNRVGLVLVIEMRSDAAEG